VELKTLAGIDVFPSKTDDKIYVVVRPGAEAGPTFDAVFQTLIDIGVSTILDDQINKINFKITSNTTVDEYRKLTKNS